MKLFEALDLVYAGKGKLTINSTDYFPDFRGGDIVWLRPSNTHHVFEANDSVIKLDNGTAAINVVQRFCMLNKKQLS